MYNVELVVVRAELVSACVKFGVMLGSTKQPNCLGKVSSLLDIERIGLFHKYVSIVYKMVQRYII